MDKKIWLMPFASVSLASYWKLQKQKVDVAGFIDNVKGCIGLIFDGLPVVMPKDIDRNSFVLISSLKYGERMKLQLIEDGFDEEHILFSDVLLTAEDIDFAKEEAKRLGIEDRFPIKNMDNAFDLYIKSLGARDQLLVNTPLELVVTQRCSLKCKECANMMQYYTDPCHINIGVILQSIDRLFEFIDYVGVLNVLGGEPFLVKELDTILNKLAVYRDKCGSLTVVTNGTIVPSAQVLGAIKRANACVEISDYGPISVRKDDLIKTLRQENIAYSLRFSKQQWWKQHYFMDEKVWGDDEVNAIFYGCRANCREIVNGRLSWCVYIAHGEVLKVFPKECYSSLDLLDETLTKKQVVDYLHRREAFPACKYCNGMINKLEYIPAAEQVSEPLPYKRWE